MYHWKGRFKPQRMLYLTLFLGINGNISITEQLELADAVDIGCFRKQFGINGEIQQEL